MRSLISVVVLAVVGVGLALSVCRVPFGADEVRLPWDQARDRVNFGSYYDDKGLRQTGASNIVTSVVLGYRGLDTLGEVTVLFIAALGLALVLFGRAHDSGEDRREPASLVVFSGCRFLFPLIVLFGTYIFLHGHLTPGGGFQGGAIIASGILLVYLGCPARRVKRPRLTVVESLSGLAFVVIGLIGLGIGGAFLLNFLPTGSAYRLISAGIMPVIYVAIGLKVGAELGGIVDGLAGDGK